MFFYDDILPESGGTQTYLLRTFGHSRVGELLAFLFTWQFLLAGPLEVASGLVNKTAPLKKTYEVPDHKAGVPDAPDMAALGFAWHVAQGPNTMLVAPLIPNDDTLAIDLVSIGDEGKGTKTWTMYDDTAPDPFMYPRWMVAAGSS